MRGGVSVSQPARENGGVSSRHTSSCEHAQLELNHLSKSHLNMRISPITPLQSPIASSMHSPITIAPQTSTNHTSVTTSPSASCRSRQRLSMAIGTPSQMGIQPSSPAVRSLLTSQAAKQQASSLETQSPQTTHAQLLTGIAQFSPSGEASIPTPLSSQQPFVTSTAAHRPLSTAKAVPL
eukprot:GHVN01096733.1.p1 GENE.GHVN01096733.1~~GHVN01096733.1.p1  ORF type:complete len:180 (+),score=26.81 GHVN01096733.1:421-960(+)